MKMKSFKFNICFVVLFLLSQVLNACEVSQDGRAITIDGKRRVLLSGSIHYPRSTPQMWPDLLRKAKEGGLDAVETYVFWNAHEPQRRQYDFNGNLDLVRFIKSIKEEGMYAVLRIGPYVCAEWNYGGFPVWLHNMPNVELRTANSVFMNEMQNFTALIVDMMKKEKLFASQGGPIIIAQIENEYGNVMSSYGDAGKAYIDWCARMADSLDIGVPWIMCQQKDAPLPMINTCNGWYCHDFTPSHPTSPKMWTENWTGWFKSWGGPNPHRTAEDVAYAVAKFYRTGGTFQNYYMYHGGTNFGRTSGGPYLTTSYDYDAPLDEYGNLNQPKYGHLKDLHLVLKSMEKTLTHGNVSHIVLDDSVTATVYETEEGSSCFLDNSNTTADATVTFKGNKYNVPAWSISVLPDCKHEHYNTAKVNAQTSLMVKNPNQAEDEPASLKWVWRPQLIDGPVVQGKGSFSASHLIDQKMINDDSDYLWYMTTLNLDKNDPIWSDNMFLSVNSSGQVLHAYVNGHYISSDWKTYGIFNSKFEKQVKLKPGQNQITLLSATVGFQNYGPKFDVVANGIPGPIELVGNKGDERIVKDLSNHKWVYKVGLHDTNGDTESTNWSTESLPTNRKMTWYKTTFKAPLGTDPVVLDLQGLGKGFAWVNGHNIGRYWPSYLAKDDGCEVEKCDYRGQYTNTKCVTDCGEPSQRFYHVPREWMTDDVNTLVLFEEFGGNPFNVNLRTVSVGTACGNVFENKTLELSCQNKVISGVVFGSFGDPQGVCGEFRKGTCDAQNDVLPFIQKECVGKKTCSIEVSEAKLGKTTCGNNVVKRLAVEAVC